MDTTALDQSEIEAEAEARLPQPSASQLSAIINGMGNGVMIAGATYIALPKLLEKVTHHTVSAATRQRGTVFAGVTGAILGTWYGIHEAKQLGEYRDKIGQEIIHLRDRVRTLEGKAPESHADKIKAAREAGEAIGRE